MVDKKRRQVMGVLSAGAVTVPLSAVVGTLPSIADDLPLVDPGSAQATALQYMAESPDSATVCGNCTLYQGAEGDSQGPCPLFPGSAVKADAWCSAYVPKA